MTTKRAAGRSAGSPHITFLTADIPPAEAPITMMSCLAKGLTEYSGWTYPDPLEGKLTLTLSGS